MKKALFLLIFFPLISQAQGSFRIFDLQNNDVTGGVFSVSNSVQSTFQVQFNVENIDSTAYDVTAGRLVVSAPVTSANAITWGLINYAPSADSSAIPVNLVSQQTGAFVGDYFPNGNVGTATINYCFWNTYDQSNNSCVTVSYIATPNGVNDPANESSCLFSNLIANENPLLLNWDQLPGETMWVSLISVSGARTDYQFNTSAKQVQISSAGMAAGVYLLEIKTDAGFLMREKVIVQ
jgi:hypothetical protein